MNNPTIISEQKLLCEKYCVEYSPSLKGWKIGLAKNIDTNSLINGLRHVAENGTLELWNRVGAVINFNGITYQYVVQGL